MEGRVHPDSMPRRTSRTLPPLSSRQSSQKSITDLHSIEQLVHDVSAAPDADALNHNASIDTSRCSSRVSKASSYNALPTAGDESKAGQSTDPAAVHVPMPPRGTQLGQTFGKNSVMISYCRRNSELVRRIHQAFVSIGVDCWIDFEDIPKGVDWWQSIKNGIERSHVCVYCISNDAIKSKVCGWEVDHMMKHNKKVLPIVVAEDFDWDDVRPDIAKLNFIFFCRQQDDFNTSFRELWDCINTDHAYLELHTRFEVWATEWDAAGRDPALLFSGEYLKVVDEFLEKAETRSPVPTDLMEDFFAASHVLHLENERKQAIVDAMLYVPDDVHPLKDAAPASWLRRRRQKLADFFNRRSVMVMMLVAITLNAVMGLAVVLLDRYVASEATMDSAMLTLNPIAIAALACFEAILFLELFAVGLLQFCTHPGFLIDTLVVTTALVLLVLNVEEGVPQLVTIVRVWRLARLFKFDTLSIHDLVAQLRLELVRQAAEARKYKRLVASLNSLEDGHAERIASLRKRINQLTGDGAGSGEVPSSSGGLEDDTAYFEQLQRSGVVT